MSDLRLVLFFTRGISLQTWDQVGMLEREVAIYRRLQEDGVQVSFITYGDAGDLRYADRIPGIRILCNRWALSPRRYERWLPLLHSWHLWRADIYKTNQTNGADVALRTARLFGKPLIARCGYMWSRFADRKYGERSDQAQHAREHERLVFESADRVVVTAHHMKKYALRQYELRDGKVTVIPNYVLTELFRPDPEICPQPGRICFVGRMNPQKNLFSLLEAVCGLDVELEIIGEGPQREDLETTAHEYGINARFLGNRPHAELPRHFNAAQIVVLPSLYEGHPKVLLEAMSCGRPVIGTDVPGIREIIEHRENGYLCGTSPDEIRAAIQDVLSNEPLRTRVSRNARRFAVKRFSLDRVVEIKLQFLSEVKELTPDCGQLKSVVAVSRAILSLAASPVLRRVRRLGKRVLLLALERLSTPQLESLIHQLAARRADALPADEALRFLFRLDAALYPVWGQQAIAYDGGVHTKHRHIHYHDFFVNRVQKGERVLDIGCGNGALSYAVAEKAEAQVLGIDISEVNIATAREQYAHPLVTYHIGDVLQDLPNRRFDVVVMSNVLEHLAERPAFLRQVQEQICPSRFLLRVPVFERHWSVPLKRELGVEWRLDPTHETEYTLENFADEMAQAGLRITHQEVRWGEIWAEAVQV